MGMTMRKSCTSVLNRTIAIAFMAIAIGLGFASNADAQKPSVYQLQEFEVGMDGIIGSTTLTYPGSILTSSSNNNYYWSTSTNYYANAPVFSFYFYDRRISSGNRIFCNPNGYIHFRNSTSPEWYPSSSNGYTGSAKSLKTTTDDSAPRYSACLMWDDLQFYGGGAKVHYKTEGNAPNRRFIIEYSGCGAKPDGLNPQNYSPSPVGKLYAQCIVYETSNVIEFHYDDGSIGMDWASHLEATIGIIGSRAHKEYAVQAALGQGSAPQSNFRFLPQFWSEWQGTSSSMTSSSNWKSWTGSNQVPWASTNIGSTSNSRNMMYIPDTSSMNFTPTFNSGNIYTSGLIIDADGEFNLGGSSHLHLERRGTGRFLNNGTFNMSGTATFTVAGDFISNGTFTNTAPDDTLIEFNGTSEFGIQEVIFTNGFFGEIEVLDGGNSQYPTLVKFVDFSASAITKLSNEEDTTMQFAGDINLGPLFSSGAISLGGGIGFATGNGPTVVDVGTQLQTSGQIVIDAPTSSDSIEIRGAIKGDTVSFNGSGSFTVTGGIDSTNRVRMSGAASLQVGDASNVSDIVFGNLPVLFPNARDVTVTGKIIARAKDAQDVTISTTGDLQLGGIETGGLVQLYSDGDMELGSVDADRGLIIDKATKLTIGDESNDGTEPAEADVYALRAGSTIDFKDIDEIEIVGKIQHDGLDDMGMPSHNGTMFLGADTSITVSANAVIGELITRRDAPITFEENLTIGALDAQGMAAVSAEKDLIVAGGDIVYTGSGDFTVLGNLVLDGGSFEFQGRPFIAKGIKVIGSPSVLRGEVELSASGFGNYFLEIESAGSLELAAGTNVKLTGNAEPIARVNGSLTSTIMGGGPARPRLIGGVTGQTHARMVFEREAKVSVDGLVLENFGNIYSPYAVVMASGSDFTKFDNVSILNSQAANAVIQLATGSLPAEVKFFEVSGTTPASIDASLVTGFNVTFTEGPNMGGNLFGTVNENDPQGVVVWDATNNTLQITTSKTLPRAPRGEDYRDQLQFLSAIGGNPPYIWSRVEATVPTDLRDWLNFEDEDNDPGTPNMNGRLVGTPPVAGSVGPASAPITFRVTDSSPVPVSVTKAFDVIFDPPLGAPLALLPPSNLVFIENVLDGKQLWGTGGVPNPTPNDYFVTHVSGTIPQGLTYANNTLSGTPLFGTAGKFTLGFTVTDAVSTSAIQMVEFTIAEGTPAPRLVTLTLPTAYVGEPFVFQLGASEGLAPYTFSIADNVNFINPQTGLTENRLETFTSPEPVRVEQLDQFGNVIVGSRLPQPLVPAGITLTSSGLLTGTPSALHPSIPGSGPGPKTFLVYVTDAYGVGLGGSIPQPVQLTLDVVIRDLGPIPISGGNTHGSGGACAASEGSNAWLVGLLTILAMVFVLRRRRQEA